MSVITLVNDDTTQLTPLLKIENNVTQVELCRTINETADSYTVVSMLNNKGFIIKPIIETRIDIREVKTIKEVVDIDNMEKIKYVYNITIGGSVFLIISSLFLMITNLFNIPMEVLFSLVLFASIGAIFFSIDLKEFNRRHKKGNMVYEKAGER